MPQGATWRYLKGTAEASSPAESWRRADFDDLSWPSGPAPFRYGDGAGGTVFDDMPNAYSTVFLRRAFDVALENVDELRLRVDYDDGFAVWINGVDVERVNAPDPIAHDALAPSGHESGTFETLALDDPERYLVDGTNVIAVQVFNTSLTSSDLMFDLELASVRPVADTRFSRDRGFYSAPFTVAVTTATAGATIRYTTDGSAPSETRGTVYTGPIPIDITTVLRAMAYRDGMEPTNVDTKTYIFLADVLRQPARPAGFPATWKDRDLNDLAADYGVDPQVVDDPRYRDLMLDAMLSVPTLSIVMDQDDLFGPNGVYYNGGSGQNSTWERPASVEMISPDGAGDLQIDFGIRPHSHVLLKRSFKLLFKSEYGETKLRSRFFRSAPLNAESAARQFDRIILRAGTNRAWSTRWNTDDTCYTRDQWARDSQVAMSGLGSRGTFVHLYLNGLYWGLYNACERPDAWFTSEYLGGDQEDCYAVNHGGDISGSSSRYDHLRSLANARGVEQAAVYDEIREYLDVAHFSDYLILNWYAGTGDWPQNNWYGGNRNSPAGPFRHFCWDAEDIFDPLGSDRPGRSNDGAWVQSEFRAGATSNRDIARIWHALRENLDFMTLFADRVARHCFNDGALTEERSRERWLKLNEFIELAVVGESARWGDARESSGEALRTRDDHWWPEVERVSEVSIARNVERLLSALRAEGYYPDLDAPVLSRHGGLVWPKFLLEIRNPNDAGSVYFALDAGDPRAPETGAVSADAIRYTEPILVEGGMVVRARVRSGSDWSPLAEATFSTLQDLSRLRLTEIMYHPPDEGEVGGKQLEFVELLNTGDVELDLTGLRFTSGIDWEFPPGDRVVPGEFIVLVSNDVDFAARYPAVSIHGVYALSLSNAGETITLVDAVGDVVFSVSYDDTEPWPEEADGDGRSLVPASANPVGDQNDPAAWRASAELLGSPGAHDGPAFPAAPVIERQPLSITVVESGDALFTVRATAHEQPAYRWQRNGRDLPGETAWFLAVARPSRAESGARYRCVVTNSQGSVTTAEATLTVVSEPASGVLLSRGAEWKFFEGTREPSDPRPLWRERDFDDSIWRPGRMPIGYGDPPFGTMLAGMEDSFSTVYLRRTFDLPAGVSITALELTADYDDGFVAWLNGIEVLRANVAADVDAAGALAEGNHESGQYESFDIASAIDSLGATENVLAIQGFNVSVSSSDFKLDVELRYEGVEAGPAGEGRFVRGDAHGDGRVDISDAVRILVILFAGHEGDGCDDARDVDDDGDVDLTDAVRTLDFLFRAGERPPSPFPGPGPDPTPDSLACDRRPS